jgi:hypothetical protein
VNRGRAAEARRTTGATAAYDEWFCAQVQASLDDPRPNVPDAEAEREFAARRKALRRRAHRHIDASSIAR